MREAHDRLRERVRDVEGRERDPSAAVIDSQSVRTAGRGGPARGYDGAKRLKGRKRHLPVDTTGLVLLACVRGADLQDRLGGQLLFAQAAAASPRLERVWADAAYAGGFQRWARDERGCEVEVVRHPDRQLRRYGLLDDARRAFRVSPRRWVAERTFAWLGQSRRLSKDYEHLPRTSEAMIYGAMSRIMLRGLARSAT